MATIKDLAIRAFLPPSTRMAPQIEQRASGFTYSGDLIPVRGKGKVLAFDPSEALNGFQANEVVYRCVDMISTALASLDLVVERDGELDDTDPLANLFNKASSDADNATARKRIMWARLEQRGECFLYMDRGETGEGDPTDFIVIHRRVTPKFRERFFEKDGITVRQPTVRERMVPPLEGYEVETDKGTIALLPSEVMWLRYPHFDIPWAPMPPGEAAMIAAGMDRKAREWQAAGFENRGRPDLHIHMGDVEREDAVAAKARIEADVTGVANAGRPIVTYGPQEGKVNWLGLSPAEMDYIESHRINGEDICHAYGVPVDLIFGRTTYENQAAAKTFLWSNVLLPKKELIEAELDRILFPDAGARAVFDTSKVEALQENTDAIVDRATKAWLADGLTLGEYRKHLGAEPFEENDPRNDMTYTAWIASQKPAPATLPPATEAEAEEEPGEEVEEELPEEEEDEERFDHNEVVTLREVRPGTPFTMSDSFQELPEQRAKAGSVERVLAAYDRHERLFTRAIQRMAERQRQSTLRKLDKEEGKRAKAEARKLEVRAIDPDDLYDQDFWTDDTRTALEGVMEGLYTDAALATAEALGTTASDDLMDSVIAAMQARLAVLATQITATTYEAISEEVLREGVEKGEGIPKLADRLQERFDGLASWRAETIARTETLGGHNQASFEAAKDSGVVVGKTWATADDTRVRVSHRSVDNESVPLDERFSNGLMFPGDPTGIPSETVNCRCVLTYELDASERKFNPRQPRDPDGKWTKTPGSKIKKILDLDDDGAFDKRRADVERWSAEAERAGLSTDKRHDWVKGQEGRWRPSRRRIHKRIVNELYAKAANVPNERQSVVAGGLGGAGKSTTLKNHMPEVDQSKFLTLNPDDIKEYMAEHGLVPQYKGLSPMEASGLVHEESSYVTSLLFQRALADGKNIIWDITMSSEKSVAKRLDAMEAENYRTRMMFVHIPVEKSVKQALSRYRRGQKAYFKGEGNGGRYVPPSFIRDAADDEYGSVNRRVYENLKDRAVGRWLFDNSGDTTKLVEKAGDLTG